MITPDHSADYGRGVLPSPGVDPDVSGPLLERAAILLANAIELLGQAGGEDWAVDVQYVHDDVVRHLDG